MRPRGPGREGAPLHPQCLGQCFASRKHPVNICWTHEWINHEGWNISIQFLVLSNSRYGKTDHEERELVTWCQKCSFIVMVFIRITLPFPFLPLLFFFCCCHAAQEQVLSSLHLQQLLWSPSQGTLWFNSSSSTVSYQVICSKLAPRDSGSAAYLPCSECVGHFFYISLIFLFLFPKVNSCI